MKKTRARIKGNAGHTAESRTSYLMNNIKEGIVGSQLGPHSFVLPSPACSLVMIPNLSASLTRKEYFGKYINEYHKSEFLSYFVSFTMLIHNNLASIICII